MYKLAAIFEYLPLSVYKECHEPSSGDETVGALLRVLCHLAAVCDSEHYGRLADKLAHAGFLSMALQLKAKYR